MVAWESPLQATAAERGDVDDPERRQVEIRRNAEAQHDGYTPDCEGRAQAELGLDHRAHSASGRTRLETAMWEDADPVMRVRVLEAAQREVNAAPEATAVPPAAVADTATPEAGAHGPADETVGPGGDGPRQDRGGDGDAQG